MSDEETATDAEGKGSLYPKKYWWLMLVVLPVLVASIKLVPDFFSKKTEDSPVPGVVAITGRGNILNSDLSTKTYVINLATIEKEYAAVKREPLVDEALKKQIETAIALLEDGKAAESATAFEKINQKISLPALQTNLGVAYQKAGKTDAATQTFSEVLAQNPDYGAAHNNLGLLKASASEFIEARGHFEKAGNIGESKALISAIEEELKNQSRELEPNDQSTEANALPLGKKIVGEIADENEADFYRIMTPAKYRDILQVEIENHSKTLRPDLGVFDRKASDLPGAHDNTPGAGIEHRFSVSAATTFFLKVSGGIRSKGRYAITARPLQSYDDYEPNEGFTVPATIEIGKEVSANIMDRFDVDVYEFRTAAEGKTVKVHLQNQSETLRPNLGVRDSSKSGISEAHDNSEGANLNHSFQVQPNAVYLISISGTSGSSGAYKLTLSQQ